MPRQKFCSVPGCLSTTEVIKREQETFLAAFCQRCEIIRPCRCPAPDIYTTRKETRTKFTSWCKAIGLKDPGYYINVCYKHFSTGCPSRTCPDPDVVVPIWEKHVREKLNNEAASVAAAKGKKMAALLPSSVVAATTEHAQTTNSLKRPAPADTGPLSSSGPIRKVTINNNTLSARPIATLKKPLLIHEPPQQLPRHVNRSSSTGSVSSLSSSTSSSSSPSSSPVAPSLSSRLPPNIANILSSIKEQQQKQQQKVPPPAAAAAAVLQQHCFLNLNPPPPATVVIKQEPPHFIKTEQQTPTFIKQEQPPTFIKQEQPPPTTFITETGIAKLLKQEPPIVTLPFIKQEPVTFPQQPPPIVTTTTTTPTNNNNSSCSTKSSGPPEPDFRKLIPVPPPLLPKTPVSVASLQQQQPPVVVPPTSTSTTSPAVPGLISAAMDATSAAVAADPLGGCNPDFDVFASIDIPIASELEQEEVLLEEKAMLDQSEDPCLNEGAKNMVMIQSASNSGVIVSPFTDDLEPVTKWLEIAARS